jgi:predicted component of type VI protein secretion system
MRAGEMDQLISSQVSAIMHAPAFKKLEQSWTGLHYLVRNASSGQGVKMRMLNASKRELVKDFQRRWNSTRAPCSAKSTKKNSAPSAVRRMVR